MENKGKGFPKKVIMIVLLAIVIVVGASISAAALLKENAKEQYFKAESQTWDQMKQVVKDRYGDELAWSKEVKKKPSESTVEFSGEYNGPLGNGMYGAEEIINNSTITLKNSIDPEKKEMALEVSANIAEMKIEDVNVYLTSDKMMASLPFLDKFLQIKESDFGELMHKFDPVTFTGEEEINFDSFFNQNLLNEDDIKHIQDTYLKMIYEELPKDAFTSEDESVDVNGESIKATKITLSLTEKQVKDIMDKVLAEAEKDEKLKEMLKNQASLNPSLNPNAAQLTQMLEDFESGIADAREELKDLQIPDGLTSTLWVEEDIIVKRDFVLKMGSSKEELGELKLTGTQLIREDKQTFDYDLALKDQMEEITLTLTGDLSWKDNKAKDNIKITSGDMELSYNGEESLDNGTREFNRTISLNNELSPQSNMELIWEGSSTYEKDKMNAEHSFALTSQEISADLFSLHVNTDAKLVKSIDIPTDSNEVVDLGSMSVEEIQTYIMEDFTPKFRQWMMEFYGSLMGTGTNMNGF
ncbi:hypothetical protein KO561_03570 [Radiobacillus kanasensis]|uniref:DUF6583 family protein n=1 Tax=Radiobacillus kanasensis TaxID=2844358 RepID=UPI001E4C59C1|nr:DUF6583 family protein [Radiobacillus kanasensis]UFU00057.1 hypothetical protein KO561_03570 [Radiobacillus kanasensis]